MKSASPSPHSLLPNLSKRGRFKRQLGILERIIVRRDRSSDLLILPLRIGDISCFTKIQVFFSPFLAQIHHINQVVKIAFIRRLQETLCKGFELRVWPEGFGRFEKHHTQNDNLQMGGSDPSGPLHSIKKFGNSGAWFCVNGTI